MKYRIKQINYSDGSKKFIPQWKESWFTWKYIDAYGYDYFYRYHEYSTREQALKVIDLNFSKHISTPIEISTEIEYIIKNK